MHDAQTETFHQVLEFLDPFGISGDLSFQVVDILIRISRGKGLAPEKCPDPLFLKLIAFHEGDVVE